MPPTSLPVALPTLPRSRPRLMIGAGSDPILRSAAVGTGTVGGVRAVVVGVPPPPVPPPPPPATVLVVVVGGSTYATFTLASAETFERTASMPFSPAERRAYT